MTIICIDKESQLPIATVHRFSEYRKNMEALESWIRTGSKEGYVVIAEGEFKNIESAAASLEESSKRLNMGRMNFRIAGDSVIRVTR